MVINIENKFNLYSFSAPILDKEYSRHKMSSLNVSKKSSAGIKLV